MSGPFDPSAGYGPAVSSGISVTDPLPLELDFVDPAAPEGAGGQGHGADTGADEPEYSSSAEEGADVEGGALVDDLLVGTVEEPAFVGGSVGGLVRFGYASHELSFLR